MESRHDPALHRAYVNLRKRDAASGDWKLENTGAGQGLFVQVQGTVTLQPDTVIRVGGSAMYRFHPED